MRIVISGAQGQGKTTLVNDFTTTWPKYIKSKESYRSLIKDSTIKNINKQATKDSQWQILQSLVADQKGLSRRDNVIFDRGVLDNLVYTLWAAGKGNTDIDDEFVKECIPVAREAMKDIDIIFFIPLTNVVVPARADRETDSEYVKEIDNIFKAIAQQHLKGQSAFFPKDDAPPIIEIFGTPEQRIEMIKLYLDESGGAIDEQHTLITPEVINAMEDLLKQQRIQLDEDKEIKAKADNLLSKFNKIKLK